MTTQITQEDINLVNRILGDVKPGKNPPKIDCKRLRRVMSKFITLTDEIKDNCFCSESDRRTFFASFNDEWNKKDLVL